MGKTYGYFNHGDMIKEMVPGTGIEPVQLLSREILSLLCLPISPPGHTGQQSGGDIIMQRCRLHRLEVDVGRVALRGAIRGAKRVR
jgi:hypothetical protein